MPPTDQPWSTPGPPPPPSPRAAPPSGSYPAPPPAPTYGGPGYQGTPFQPSAYPAGGNWAPAKPPRPATPIAGIMLIAGSVIMVIGTVVPWGSIMGESFNGWDIQDIDNDSSAAGGFVFLAVVLAGFGITTLAAKRLLPIAILAVIFAAFAIFAALGQLILLVQDELLGEIGVFGLEYDASVGLWVVFVGAAMTLAGAIWTLSVRRKWRAPAPTA